MIFYLTHVTVPRLPEEELAYVQAHWLEGSRRGVRRKGPDSGVIVLWAFMLFWYWRALYMSFGWIKRKSAEEAKILHLLE